ncbi:DUF4439 domain-containing protein [Brachybacterium sp. EF45031]|uniref:ferritin-like domain-containing protein n=1 Tax=Brachybacterium sillae TaxID=2810536 RepID=UPI00217E4B60|nr:ferritin-like domain-containing protein [Brachybacterium sillae]MCS6712345.1 DUF4439 domain-containing protein [Brachybacterium sillae]
MPRPSLVTTKDPSRRGPSSPDPSRRSLLQGAVAGVVTMPVLAACGSVRVGSPAPQTPPPPGIDDLYRRDLLEAVESAWAAAGTPAGAAPAVASALEELRAALQRHREALRTGAEAEAAASAESSSAAAGSPAASPVATDPAALRGRLVALREMCADAAVQISGRLARPVTAVGAHATWAAVRLAALEARAAGGSSTAEPTVPAPRPAERLTPTREVPAWDPPSIGAEQDYHHMLDLAQQDEWFAAWLHEVIAARSTGQARNDALTLRDRHRTRAEELAGIARADQAPVAMPQAVYALGGDDADDEALARRAVSVSAGLIATHVALAGAAPFERRAVAVAAAYEEATWAGPRVPSLAPLPSLRLGE